MSSLKNVDHYVNGILNADRVLLARAITFLESQKQSHRELANEILKACIPHAGNSIRIGISGSPGVGKSTFIEAFGKTLIQAGKKVAVLAVDPSSSVTKGSILGDKTRMPELSTDPNAFIRPSPSGKTLGGVTNATRESILLCEAAAYDVILVETVGVGQSETEVHSLVDLFVLLLLPGAGDELQGIKRGIVELADLVLVNKADGKRIEMAKEIKKSYSNALHLYPAKENGLIAEVMLCSALEKTGMKEIWEKINSFEKELEASGFKNKQRENQKIQAFENMLERSFLDFVLRKEGASEKKEEVIDALKANQLSVYEAVSFLLEKIK